MKVNYTIYLKAKCQPRYRNSNIFELKVQNVEQLYDVKAHRLERFTISLDATSLDDEFVSELSTVVGESEGNTQLYIQLRTPDQNNILLHSRNRGINVDRQLIDFVAANEKLEYHIN